MELYALIQGESDGDRLLGLYTDRDLALQDAKNLAYDHGFTKYSPAIHHDVLALEANMVDAFATPDHNGTVVASYQVRRQHLAPER